MSSLSILIPFVPEHEQMMLELKYKLYNQIAHSGLIADILVDGTPASKMTIGEKRNVLLSKVETDYTCFIDADDDISDNYISLIEKSLELKPDCVSLRGEYRENGVFDGVFEHSIKYNQWRTAEHGAPIKNGWYDLDKLPPASMVLVDGACRGGVLNNLHLFHKDTKYLIHDTYRESEMKLATDLGVALNRPVQFFDGGDFFAWV